MSPRHLLVPLLGVAACLVPAAVLAGNTLRVTLSVDDPADGHAGCALYDAADGFPAEGDKARSRQWYPAARTIVCEFVDLPDGVYAIGASHDTNGNRLVDTNLFGMPKESWGVSRNVRPGFRAPRFDEAAVVIEGGGTTELAIEVRR